MSFCARVLGGQYRFLHALSAVDAQRHLLEHPEICAVLLDRDFSKCDPQHLMGSPGDARNEGLSILRWLRREHSGLPVLMVTGYREKGAALEAAELGAEFLAWDDICRDPDILRARLSRSLELGDSGTAAILSRFRECGIVVESETFSRTLVKLHQAVSGGGPILLLGETGTGKDILAFAVHALSGDSGRPFVNVNVAALNPGLIETELFGHVRGAYTGAVQSTIGKLRYANGGTLFLNEIAELSYEVQAKVLTALERREVVPVGDVRSFPSDYRLITATSRDLPAFLAAGRFREDLLHRIAHHTIHVPPLRERRDDIPALIRVFLRDVGQGAQEGLAGIAREAVEYLCDLPWKGNVRQLKSVIEAAAASAAYIITLADVREVIRRYESLYSSPGGMRVQGEGAGEEPSADLLRCEETVFGRLSYRDVTARYFRYLHRLTGGRLPEVARVAGIARATAYEWKDRFESREG